MTEKCTSLSVSSFGRTACHVSAQQCLSVSIWMKQCLLRTLPKGNTPPLWLFHRKTGRILLHTTCMEENKLNKFRKHFWCRYRNQTPCWLDFPWRHMAECVQPDWAYFRPLPIWYVCCSRSKCNVHVNNMAVSLCTIILARGHYLVPGSCELLYIINQKHNKLIEMQKHMQSSEELRTGQVQEMNLLGEWVWWAKGSVKIFLREIKWQKKQGGKLV